MKHLKGNKKRYFSLAIIAMYSTLHKLCRLDSSYKYHKIAFSPLPRKTAPPA
ncbi:MAG: hypothetical protein HF962_07090 [Sulfurovum sp.]|nr:hypothetical protein [Sulfurovum sp.]